MIFIDFCNTILMLNLNNKIGGVKMDNNVRPETMERINSKEAIWVIVRNTIDTSTYSGITVDNISMNGRQLTREDMSIELIGNVGNVKIEKCQYKTELHVHTSESY